MDKKIIYIRHGERPSIQYDPNILMDWQSSKRYKENLFDELLTENGHRQSYITGLNLHKYVDTKPIKFFYCSPFTRCVETAIHIISALKRPDIKIRIEYGLHENVALDLNKTLVVENGRIKEKILNYYQDYNGVKHYTSLDKKLKIESLSEKYKPYIDKNYKSLYSFNDMYYNRSAKIAVKYCINTIKHIIENNDQILIVGHAGAPFRFMHFYLLKEKYNKMKRDKLDSITGGYNGLNFVSIYTKSKDKWINTLPPRQIFK
jgi:Fructose-2,6-bisphosphatase